MMQAALRSLMKADAALAALVAGRIDWSENAQGAPQPRITLHIASNMTDYHSKGPSGLEQTRVQVDVWADDAGSRKAVGDAVKTLLSGYRGSHDGIEFQGIFAELLRETGGQMRDGGSYLYRRQMDFMINWRSENVT